MNVFYVAIDVTGSILMVAIITANLWRQESRDERQHRRKLK
jgi:hypothetical protein